MEHLSADLPSCFLDRRSIGGKDVYVVDDHHKVLAAWALVRRTMPSVPNLITIDHHTDTFPAFLRFAHWACDGRLDDKEKLQSQLVGQIDFADDQSICAAIAKLRHDEHISAATGSGIILNAFCIQLSDARGYQSIEQNAFSERRTLSQPYLPGDPEPTAPFTYLPAADHIYVISHEYAAGSTLADEIISAKHLDDQLARCAQISKCFGVPNIELAPYILDIDLDVFHSRKSITTQETSTFYRLIKNSAAVTIATEAKCVHDLWIEDEQPMAAEALLQALIAHIEKAVAQETD